MTTLGHLGHMRTVDLLRTRFRRPFLDVEEYIKNCGECVTHKKQVQRAAPSYQIISPGAMDLRCIDFLSMEPDLKGISNVLVGTDHFTRYAQAFPSRSQKAPVVAKAWKNTLCTMVCPQGSIQIKVGILKAD